MKGNSKIVHLEEPHLVIAEYNFSSFERTFKLPAIVEGEQITASYFDGILKITVTEKDEARKKSAKPIVINEQLEQLMIKRLLYN